MLPEVIARTTLLHRYPLLRSGSMELACNSVSPEVSGFDLGGLPGEFTATGNFIRLNNIALAYLSYGAAAPYAALMVAISAVPAYLLSRRMGTLARAAGPG